MRISHIDDIGAALPRDVAGRRRLAGVSRTRRHPRALNEPGRTEWEGFAHGTRRRGCRRRDDAAGHAAQQRAGDDPEHGARAEAQQRRAASAAWTSASSAASCRATRCDLTQLWLAGVFGFKCFLVPSGVDEFRHVTEPDLRDGAASARDDSERPCSCTPSCPGPIDAAASALLEGDPRSYATYLASRPRDGRGRGRAS